MGKCRHFEPIRRAVAQRGDKRARAEYHVSSASHLPFFPGPNSWPSMENSSLNMRSIVTPRTVFVIASGGVVGPGAHGRPMQKDVAMEREPGAKKSVQVPTVRGEADFNV